MSILTSRGPRFFGLTPKRKDTKLLIYGLFQKGRVLAQDAVEVLKLQQGKAKKKFRVSFLVPVAGLLEDGVLGNNVIPARARRVLAAMVNELRVGLAVG